MVPGKGEFNKISGEFRRYKPSGKLRFIVNDVLPLADFEAGQVASPATPAAYRIGAL